MIDAMLSGEAAKLDGQAIDRMASAKSRLYEIERVLAGRPTPGSLRPTAEKPRRGIGARLEGL